MFWMFFRSFAHSFICSIVLLLMNH
jgi:hypothetical protein